MSRPPTPLPVRLFRACLSLAPPAWRREVGDEVERTFRARLAEERRRGPGRAAWFAVRETADVAWVGLRARLEAAGRRVVGDDDDDGNGRRWMMRGTRVGQAVRALVRRPVYALTAILTLAVGFGATTSVGVVADAILVDGLPFEDADRTWLMWGDLPQLDLGVEEFQVSAIQHRYVREQSRTLEDVAAFTPDLLNLGPAGEVVRVAGARVSAPFFRTLGVALARGRPFRPEEEVEGRDRVVVLSDRLWRDRFEADPDVVGRTVRLDGVPHEVVGVAAPGFDFPRGAELPSHLRFPERADLWLPLVHRERGPALLLLLGRTRAGVTGPQLQEDLDRIAARIGEDVPGYGPWASMAGAPLQEKALGPVRPAVGALLGGVVLLLLLACVNVAALLLTRVHGRAGEMAVRRALGASRSDLAGLVVLEALLLGGTAGALGLLLAAAGLDGAERLLGPQLPTLQSLSLEPLALAALAALTVGAVALVSALPLTVLRGGGLFGALRSGTGRGGARGGAPRSGGRPGRSLGVLATLQIALCCTLLVGTGLLTRSLIRTLDQEVGFDPEGLVTVDLTLPEASYPDLESRTRFHEVAVAALADLPGVDRASLAAPLPMSGAQEATTIAVEGRSYTPEETPVVEYSMVSPSFFGSLGIERRSGRLLTDEDRRDGPLVGVVNESMAELLWPGREPLGRRVKISGEAAPWGWIEVVGVVEDIRRVSLTTAPSPELYLPLAQAIYPSPPLLDVQYVLRTVEGAPTPSVQAVADALHGVDPGVAPDRLRSMDALIGRTYARSRALTVVFIALGGVAGLVAVVGLYGAVAFSVEGRRREIGVRLAMGAAPRRVAARVVGDGLVTAGAGVGAGLAVAALASGSLRSLLFQVSPLDPVVFAGVGGLMVLTAALAAASPARRAAGQDPASVLRSE